jgi:hypothetical protein
LRKKSFDAGSASRITAARMASSPMTVRLVVVGVYQEGVASSIRRATSSWLGPVLLPDSMPEKSALLPSPAPRQQSEMPPTTQVTIRDGFLPFELKNESTAKPTPMIRLITPPTMSTPTTNASAPSASVPA